MPENSHDLLGVHATIPATIQLSVECAHSSRSSLPPELNWRRRGTRRDTHTTESPDDVVSLGMLSVSVIARVAGLRRPGTRGKRSAAIHTHACAASHVRKPVLTTPKTDFRISSHTHAHRTHTHRTHTHGTAEGRDRKTSVSLCIKHLFEVCSLRTARIGSKKG